MILQFACAKAGFILYHLDPAVATTDPALSQQQLVAALEATSANILVSQEAGSDVNYIRLVEDTTVIPELRFFDYASGMPFVTPRFPHLRMCIHTGFDQEDKWGWLPYRHMIVPAPNNTLENYVTATTASSPLAGELRVVDGSVTAATTAKTHQEVVQENLWPSYTKVLQREFHTVEGVGVIF